MSTRRGPLRLTPAQKLEAARLAVIYSSPHGRMCFALGG